MQKSGPDIQTLIHRLAETPVEFLEEPKIASAGRLPIAAVVNDLLARFGRRGTERELQIFIGDASQQDRNRLQLVALACWLLAEPAFVASGLSTELVLRVLTGSVKELASSIRADKCVTDVDRREEFARFILARLNLRPKGESVAQATDRLSALSSTERQRLLRESQAAEKRAREIRQALARKAAQESADKWTRE